MSAGVKVASRTIGKREFQKSLVEFSRNADKPISDAHAGRLADHIKRYIMESLRNGDNFLFDSFGTLKVITRKERNGVNPRTQEKLRIPAKKTVRFSVSPNFKKLLNEKD